MARLLSAALAACLAAAPAAAQSVPPLIEARRLTKRNIPRSAANLVGVGNCFVTLALPEVTEIAFITVELRGPWERSAEHLAKQASAELGGNCLMPLQKYGPEDDNYPVVRQYRAFVVTTVINVPEGSFRVPAPARAFASPPSAAAPSMPSLERPVQRPVAASPKPPTRAEVPHGPVWFEKTYLDSHDIILDLSRLSGSDWEAVRADVAAYFDDAELHRLIAAQALGETVALDLRNRRVIRHDEAPPPPSPRGKLILHSLP